MKEKKIFKYALNVVMGVIIIGYVYSLLKIILFKYGFTSDAREINMIPFQFIKMFSGQDITIDVALKNILGNIAIFIPLGILISRLLPKKQGLTICLCIIVSCLFEMIQLITGCGATDIDDIILNSIGGVIGIVLYRFILKRFDEKANMPIATVVFLCIFGMSGCMALYLYSPGILPAQIEHVNKEAIQNIDESNYDLETLMLGVEDNYLITTTESQRIYIPEGKSVDLPIDGKYKMSDNIDIIKKEIKCKYSPNGNVQKTTVIYSKITKNTLMQELDEGEISGDIFLDETGRCKTIIFIKRY